MLSRFSLEVVTTQFETTLGAKMSLETLIKIQVRSLRPKRFGHPQQEILYERIPDFLKRKMLESITHASMRCLLFSTSHQGILNERIPKSTKRKMPESPTFPIHASIC